MIDRAARVTVAVMQMIIASWSNERQLRQQMEDYLRDEFADVVRETLNDIRLDD